MRLYRIAVWLIVGCGLAGCASRQAALPATRPNGQRIEVLAATCYPPNGWAAEPLKVSPRHHHQVWVSPGGATAYGVIHFSLPLPVSADLALWGFLREMKRTEGTAELLSKQSADDKSGLLFDAQGGLYRVRGLLHVDGWEGWVAYAGTRTDHPIDPAELEIAARARDSTQFKPQ